MPFLRPNLTAIRNNIYSDVVSGTGLPVLRKSVLGSLSWALSGAINAVYGYIDWISKEAVPFTATGEYLAAWGALKGVFRNTAQAAQGTTVVTATQPATILQDSVFARNDGTQYIAVNTTDLNVGLNTIDITCIVNGAVGNCLLNTPLIMITPVTGVTSYTSSKIITSGTDDETDDLLRSRILQRYADPPQGGSEADYLSWAFANSDVTRVWVNPYGAGGGTVVLYLMFDGNSNQGFSYGTTGVSQYESRAPAATLELLEVADYIYPLRPVTALVYCAAPINYPVNIVITGLVPNNAQTQAAIQANLVSLFLYRGSPINGTIYTSDINAAIDTATGVQRYTLVSPTLNVTTETGYLPTLGWINYL